MAQGEVLQSQLPVAAAEEREESEQVEQRSDHGARFSRGQGRRSIALATGRGFGEGQGRRFESVRGLDACQKNDPLLSWPSCAKSCADVANGADVYS